jgi:hypothetical protein
MTIILLDVQLVLRTMGNVSQVRLKVKSILQALNILVKAR